MTRECKSLKKIYHSSGSPSLSAPLGRETELYWIKELGTAKPYGFNDQIKGVSTLSNTSCKKMNVYTLLNNIRGEKGPMENATTIKRPLSQSPAVKIIIIISVILLIVIITSIGYLWLTMRFGFELLLWV